MLGSTSNRSTNRSMPTIFKKRQQSKRVLSSLLNNADFEICQPPDENEILEMMQHPNSNPSQPDSTTLDDTLTDKREQATGVLHCSPISNRGFRLSGLKQRLTSHRHETAKKHENNDQKNNGFVLIDSDGTDVVLLQNDTFDQQNTRHPELCDFGPVDDESIDINQLQLLSATPATPSLLPPEDAMLSSSSISSTDNHISHEPDIQATQAGVECAPPTYDEQSVHDTQLSATDSTSSTNSSSNDPRFTDIDRATLSDNDYIQAQKNDLERITILEIELNDELRDNQQTLYQYEREKPDLNTRYKEALQINALLKEELKVLSKKREEQDRVYAPWTCEVCTFINEPHIKTGKDVCEMCEGPSPLKRYALTT